jgi:TetR/AcrR family transcriptional regulator
MATNSQRNQRQLIIDTASKLFREQGYAKTSISQIARVIGLDQSSIYYWFKSKEEILVGIYDPNATIPLLNIINEEIEDRVVQLYSLIVYDVVRKCELPFDFIELEALIHEHPEKYQGLLEGYKNYYHAFINIISSGIEEGIFNECPVDEQAVTILSINEGLQHHYHAKKRNQLILTSCDYLVKDYSPHAIGHMAARTIIPGMVVEPQDIQQIHDSAYSALQAVIK